jgi:iron complex outermembrane receptor protein
MHMRGILPNTTAMARYGRLAPLLCLLPLLGPVPALGADDIETIVVSARRLDENLQEIPLAVSVLDERRIETEAIRSLGDVATLTPTLQFDQGFWPGDTRISIRGLFARAGRPSAAVLVDGIDMGTEQLESAGGSALLNERLLDLQRVEVIKGPQSALYGRAAFGGAINYITRRPSMDGLTASATVDVAPRYGRRELRAGVSGPLIENTLAVGILGSDYTLDGYYDNPNTGRPIGGGDSQGGLLGLLWTPGDNFEAYLTVSVNQDDQAPGAIAAIKANTTLGPVAGTSLRAVTGTIKAGEQDINISPDPRDPSRDYPGLEVDTLRTNLILNWDLGAVTLESRTGYLDSDQRLRQDTTQQFGYSPGSAGNNTDSDYLFNYEQWQQEFILRPSDDSGRWHWLVGAQGFWEDASDTNRSRIWFRDPASAGCGILSFDGRYIPCAFEDAVPLGKVITRDTTSYSLFGLVGLDVTDRLTVTLEGRLIHDKVEVEASTAAALADTLTPIFLLPAGYPGAPPRGEVDDTNFVPRISVDYRLGDNHLLYASAANGIKPPTYNTTDLQDPRINQVDKEKLWSYELGAKTSWLDGTLLVNGAVYFNDYEDQQVLVQFQPTSGVIPRSGTANASTVEIWGAELELSWQPSEYWTLSASYAFNDGEFKDFNLAKIQGPDNPVSTSNQVKAGNVDGDFSGRDIVGIPKHALSLLARHQRPLPVGDGIDWFVQTTAQFQDERYADVANLVTLDSYWLANLQLGLEHDTWSILAYAENVFDDDTVRYAQEFIDQQEGFVFNSGFAYPVAYYAYLPQPRTVGLRVVFRTR